MKRDSCAFSNKRTFQIQQALKVRKYSDRNFVINTKIKKLIQINQNKMSFRFSFNWLNSDIAIGNFALETWCQQVIIQELFGESSQ